MADETPSSSSPTPNGKSVPLPARIFCAIIAGSITPWILTQCSLHGFNFETFGINSEIIKSGISGTLTGIAVAPECIPLTIAGCVFSTRIALRTIKNSFTKPLPPDDNKE